MMRVRDSQRKVSFNFSVIANAQLYYAGLGYRETPIPWVISEEAYMATIPPGVARYETLGGFYLEVLNRVLFNCCSRAMIREELRQPPPVFETKSTMSCIALIS